MAGELFRCGCRSIPRGWRMRWQGLLHNLDDLAKAILRALADGSELTRLISPLKLSRSSLQIRKERLATGIRQCLGQTSCCKCRSIPAGETV